MMRIVTPALFATLLFICAGAVSAQDKEIGSNLESRKTIGIDRDHLRAVVMAHQVIGCATVHFPNAARRYLESTDQQSADRAWSDMFATELSCSTITGQSNLATDSRIIPSVDIGRGIIAETLLSHMQSLPPLAPAALQRSYSASWSSLSARAPAVDEMAVCVASTNPSAIEALLKTQPAGRDEMQAISAMSPSLGQCLVANAQLAANSESIRAALAEALYHRIMAPTQDSASSASAVTQGK